MQKTYFVKVRNISTTVVLQLLIKTYKMMNVPVNHFLVDMHDDIDRDTEYSILKAIVHFDGSKN